MPWGAQVLLTSSQARGSRGGCSQRLSAPPVTAERQLCPSDYEKSSGKGRLVSTMVAQCRRENDKAVKGVYTRAIFSALMLCICTAPISARHVSALCQPVGRRDSCAYQQTINRCLVPISISTSRYQQPLNSSDGSYAKQACVFFAHSQRLK